MERTGKGEHMRTRNAGKGEHMRKHCGCGVPTKKRCLPSALTGAGDLRATPPLAVTWSGWLRRSRNPQRAEFVPHAADFDACRSASKSALSKIFIPLDVGPSGSHSGYGVLMIGVLNGPKARFSSRSLVSPRGQSVVRQAPPRGAES